jgi:MFS superfamily sulfate permease-like transporter
MKNRIGEHLSGDFRSSLVVFLVALPLCLGIAIASGAPPMAGLLAGIIGGIVVGGFSKSAVSVSGPAAGLTVIVLDSISSLGSFPLFLGALVAAGIIQFLLGLAKAGVLGYYFPNAVIKGMLTAIGIILVLKQIPHALGYDKDFLGDFAFAQADQHNTFSEIYYAILFYSPGAIPIVLTALGLILFFERPALKRNPILGLVPGALWAVLSSIGINAIYKNVKPEWVLDNEHLVILPTFSTWKELSGLITFPDFNLINTSNFWIVAVTLAVIGSIETLLSIEAGDKMDPLKRSTPTNRELVAQGIGNTLSGLIGGLPVTAVIVRTSANIESGALTKWSTIFHGILLLALVLTIPGLLNQIPLSGLAAVLLVVGYKLAKPSIFLNEYKKGWDQFLPFMVTVTSILLTDLLVGIGIGMVVGLFFVIKTNFHRAVLVTERKGNYLVKLQKDVSFLNKAPLMKELSQIPAGSNVVLNASMARFIDHDIQEVLNDFITTVESKNITLSIEGYSNYIKESE